MAGALTPRLAGVEGLLLGEEGMLRLEDRVQLGMMFPASERADALRFARRSEEAGLDSLWVGDHVAFHVPIPDAVSTLAFLAAATERISLGTAVYLLPLRHPVHAAKAAAAIDRLSGGRLVFGVGVGGEYSPEFEASCVAVGERGARTDEAIPLVRRLWREERVAHAGHFYRFGSVALAPKPVQPGGPPIWIGGRAPAAMRRAGRLGDGYVSTMMSPERYRTNLALIASEARAAGRDGSRFATGALLFTALDASYAAALDRAAALLGRLYARPFREAAAKYCLLGRPEDCLAGIQRFVDAGVRHVILAPLGDPGELLEVAARDLVGAVHALAPSAPSGA
jgi:probable F420-dependent oxidoreductase